MSATADVMELAAPRAQARGAGSGGPLAEPGTPRPERRERRAEQRSDDRVAHLQGDAASLEVASGSFGRHFGARMVAERRRGRRPLWVMATRSKGAFTIRDLRDAEAGLLPLEPDTVVALAALYGMTLRAALPPTSRGLEVADGTLSAGGVTVVFRADDSRSMVDAYFRLVRTLRAIDDPEVRVPVRHDDLVDLVAHLQRGHAGSSALERVVTMANAEGRAVVGSLLAGVDALDLADED